MNGSKSRAGHIYILQNDSHDNLVLKIGLTRGKPEVRAKQLYWGSSGVPEHFDIAVAYSVGDCVDAERKIHERLDAYRINPKREFFRVDPRVAQTIVVDTCKKVNSAMGLGAPIKFRFENKKSTSYIKPIPDIPGLDLSTMAAEVVELSTLKIAPIGTCELSEAQIDRIQIVSLILTDVLGVPLVKFIETFTRDKYPEPEIVVWENIAKVYQQFDSETLRSESERKSAYRFILSSSMLTGAELEQEIANCQLSYETMLSIVKSMGK